MSAATPAPPAATPVEARSHAVTVAAPPVPSADRVCVANFKDAARAERAVADLVALGLPADEVRSLKTLEDRRELLDGFRYDRPAVHTQAGVGAAIFGAVGAVMVSLGALILFPQPPGIEWFFIVAFTAGILGACLGGGVGWYAFRPQDDPHDPLSEQVATAGPAVAVLDVEHRGPDGAPIPMGRIARTLVRAGGNCRYLTGGYEDDPTH
ncbi:hypothetical protein [Alienimonas chondri]|nr:hypothetical protein [Alienimonas chondri]